MGGRGSGSGFIAPAPTPPAPQLTPEQYLGPKGAPKDLQTAMQLANPNFEDSRQKKDGLYTRNCQRCIWAVELLRRGYDVEALPRTSDDTYAMSDSSKPHSYTNVGDPPLQFGSWVGNMWYKPKATDVKNEILQHPEGSRGALIMHAGRSGHVCNWEIKNGKVIIYDGQVNQKHTLTDLMRRGYSAFRVARMDNVGLTDLVKDFVKRR